MLVELEIDEPSFASVYRDAEGELRPAIKLPHYEAETLVIGCITVL